MDDCIGPRKIVNPQKINVQTVQCREATEKHMTGTTSTNKILQSVVLIANRSGVTTKKYTIFSLWFGMIMTLYVSIGSCEGGSSRNGIYSL